MYYSEQKSALNNTRDSTIFTATLVDTNGFYKHAIKQNLWQHKCRETDDSYNRVSVHILAQDDWLNR